MKLVSKKKRVKERKPPEKEISQPFMRGFAPSRRIVEKRGKYNRSCYNCDYYYKDTFDDHEMCQNPQVLSYDMYVTENNICCSQWKQSVRMTDAKTLFKKGR